MGELMKYFLLIGLFILGACGKSDSSQDGDALFEAPVLSGSAFNGMIFTSQAPDPSIPTGRSYQYDFQKGSIRALSYGESANAAVFGVGTSVLLFNRLEGHIDFRIVTPGSSPTISSPMPLDVEAGDPFDAVSLVDGKTALIAEPLGGKLRILDYISGTLSQLNTTQAMAVDPLRPIGLLRDGDQVAIIHTGIEVKSGGFATSNTSQQIFRAKIDSSGRASYQDANTSTSAIDGIPLAGSNPSNFFNRKKNEAKVLSLCNSRIKSCRAAFETFNDTRVSQSTIWDGIFSYDFHGQIVDGPTEDQVFALVKSSQGQSLLVKIDLPTRSIEEIQSFSSDRLFGIAYDRSAGNLFVGGTKDGLGSLTIYKNQKKLEEISLDGVFYRGVFVNY